MGANILIYFVQRPLRKVNNFFYSELECSAGQGSLSEVSLHVGQHLRRAWRWSRGIRKLGRVGKLQLLQPLYVLIAQCQELHVTLLHWIWLLGRSTSLNYYFVPTTLQKFTCSVHMSYSLHKPSKWSLTFIHRFLQYYITEKHRKLPRMIKCHQEITTYTFLPTCITIFKSFSPETQLLSPVLPVTRPTALLLPEATTRLKLVGSCPSCVDLWHFSCKYVSRNKISYYFLFCESFFFFYQRW